MNIIYNEIIGRIIEGIEMIRRWGKKTMKNFRSEKLTTTKVSPPRLRIILEIPRYLGSAKFPERQDRTKTATKVSGQNGASSKPVLTIPLLPLPFDSFHPILAMIIIIIRGGGGERKDPREKRKPALPEFPKSI